MFYTILFFFSSYTLIDLLISDNPKWKFNLDDWKKAEGIVFRVINQEDFIYEIRFVTDKLEWITAIPSTYSFSSFNSLSEGDKVEVYYNSKKPNEFSVNGTWLMKNSQMVKWFYVLLQAGIVSFSLYKIIETGFANEILNFF
jgi:hypothetical protein